MFSRQHQVQLQTIAHHSLNTHIGDGIMACKEASIFLVQQSCGALIEQRSASTEDTYTRLLEQFGAHQQMLYLQAAQNFSLTCTAVAIAMQTSFPAG